MEPLDIRVVRFLDAVEKAGLDPSIEKVKRAIEQMLSGVVAGDVPETDRPLNPCPFKFQDEVSWNDGNGQTKRGHFISYPHGVNGDCAEVFQLGVPGTMMIEMTRLRKRGRESRTVDVHWPTHPKPNHTITTKDDWKLGQQVWYYCPFTESIIRGTIGAFTDYEIAIIWTDPTSVDLSTARRSRLDDLRRDDGNIRTGLDLRDSAGFSVGDRVCWGHDTSKRGTIVGFAKEDGDWTAILYCSAGYISPYRIAVSELTRWPGENQRVLG